jgi:hypothetical protein
LDGIYLKKKELPSHLVWFCEHFSIERSADRFSTKLWKIWVRTTDVQVLWEEEAFKFYIQKKKTNLFGRWSSGRWISGRWISGGIIVVVTTTATTTTTTVIVTVTVSVV